jgi:hypothetical protein
METPRLNRLYRFFFGGPVRSRISTGVIVAVIAAAILGTWAAVRSSDGNGPSSTGLPGPTPSPTPKNRADEIGAREFWIHPPEVFEPVPDTFDPEVVNLGLEGIDVEAYTPRELADDAAQYRYLQDHVFFIVGRVIDTAFRKSAFGLGREVFIVGRDNSAVAVIGAPNNAVSTCCYDRGQVVYAVVHLAALGDARIGGRTRQAVYVVTTDDYAADISTVDFPITNIGSRAIRTRAIESRRP